MTITTIDLRGASLLADNVNYILQHPECWDQSQWHCGTTHCIAGLAQVRTGSPVVDGEGDAAELYKLSAGDAAWLFASHRSLSEIHAFAAALTRGEMYFDRDGYDRDGYNRTGYDRTGYDRDGYGYDRDGYDRTGYDRTGSRLPLIEID